MSDLSIAFYSWFVFICIYPTDYCFGMDRNSSCFMGSLQYGPVGRSGQKRMKYSRNIAESLSRT